MVVRANGEVDGLHAVSKALNACRMLNGAQNCRGAMALHLAGKRSNFYV